MPRGKPNPEYFGKPPEAVRAFQAQRTTARRRGIPFLFTFTEWWAWWQIDNRWANRGMGADKFVMARKGDEGPYSLDNVYCATHSQNTTDSNTIRDHSDAVRRGWITNPQSRNPKGFDNAISRRIETPDGIFANASFAAEHYGITRQGARYRAQTGKAGWRYIEPAGQPSERP